jgi:protein TonB
MAELRPKTDDGGPVSPGSDAGAVPAARPLDPLQLLPATNIDRLPPMLFLAALIHGILILGVTFNAFLDYQIRDSISLEVTIVADPENTIDMPDEAEYLAQASQEGAGNTTETARPRAPAQSSMPIDNAGVEDGNSLIESTDVQRAADQILLSRTEQEHRVADSPRLDPQSEIATAIALEAGLDVTLPLPQDQSASLLIRDDNPRQLVTSVNTKESKIAGYLDRWKRKIETIGVKYFPEKGIMQGLAGSPTLEVTINSAGQLEEVYVRETSGSKILDQAAINILRRAAPFDPFPEAIRVDYDQLRFAYKWQFSEIGAAATASIN